jgi:tetratricopeptide (TPR) repeat protein
MKKSLLVFSAILLVLSNLSAHPIKRAIKKMKLYDYSSAVKILEKAVITTDYHDNAIPLLAECYRLQNDQINAEKWYSLAVELPEALPDWFYYDAQSLRSTGDYVKAREMFLVYADLRPEDPRGTLYASFCDSVLGRWKDKFPDFEVKTVDNINSPESDFGPDFYSGQLVFASERNLNMDESKYGWKGKGYVDLVNTSPNAPNQFWGNMKSPKLLNGKFNRSYHDGPAVFVGNNLVYFTRTYTDRNKNQDNIISNRHKIYYATCDEGKWGPLKPFFLNSSDYSVGYPTLSDDGKTLVFVSDMPNGFGGTDLWVCRQEDGKWSNPENLGPGFNTSGNEIFPSIQPDGSLMFSSDLLPGFGGQDIFSSKSCNDLWLKPENVGVPINSSFDDFGINYAPNDQGGFFTSNRPGGAGSDDIYAFRERETFEPEITKLVETHKH